MSLSLVLLGAGAARADAVTLGPSVETAPSPGRLTFWGSSGPLTGDAVGTLMGDATVRLTSAPTVAVAVTGPAAALVGAGGRHLDGGGAVPAYSSDDAEAVGSVVTASTGSTVDATLWAVDLAAATSRTRSLVGLPSSSTLVGSTADGWVTTTGPGEAVLWPYDGSAARPVAVPTGSRTLYADSAGVVALATSPTVRLLRIAPDLTTTTTLRDWGTTAAPMPSALRVSGAGGRLAWLRSDLGEVGYVEGSGTPTYTTLPALRSDRVVGLVVLPGQVLVARMSTLASPNACDALLSWTVGAASVVAQARGTWEGGQTCTFWPSATSAGEPAAAALVVNRSQVAFEPYYESRWMRWNGPSSFASRVAGAPPRTAQLVAAAGTLGHVVTAYDTSISAARIEVVAPVAGTPVLASTAHGFTNPLTPFVAASGPRWAVVESGGEAWTGTDLRLVLRDGTRVSARIPVRAGTPVVAGRVGSLSMSGPFTAYLDLGSRTGRPLQFAGHVVGPDGSTVATVPELATHVAQDGQYVAYVSTKDHSFWLLDTSLPRSASNPRMVYAHCRIATCGRVARLMLSSGFLVASTVLPNGTSRLVVVDLAHRIVHTKGIGVRTCDAMTGRVVACRITRTRAVQLVDVATPGALFTSLGVTSGIPVSFAGQALVSSGASDAEEGYTTTARITGLPSAVLRPTAPRVLGPWSPTGALVSSSRSSRWWRPQFSFSDRVDRWVLALRDGSGRVVRTWSGNAVDGMVRGVVWDGRSSTGLALAAGTYRWILAGRGPSGVVVATFGTGTATGSVRLAG